MAMQILEENRKPTFLEQLGTGIEGFQSGFKEAKEKQLEERRNLAYSKLLRGEELSDEEGQLLDPSMMAKAKELELKRLDMLTPKKTDLEYQEKLMDKEQLHNRAQTSFNALANLLGEGNVGFGSEYIGYLPGAGKTAKDVGKFTSHTGTLEGILVEMVSKGRLSDSRFKYITEQLLPKAGDRQETIRGKLEALAEMLGLDPSALTGSVGLSGPQDKAGIQQIDWSEYYG